MNTSSEWEALFNAVSDAVCLMDKTQVITRCNAAMKDLCGLPETEIIGSPCWKIIHGIDKNYSGCPVSVMEKTRRRESLDMRIGDKWFQVTVDPILDENGDIERTVHIIRDITRQKSIEEELKKTSDRFRAMIDTAPYGAHLYELTADGRLVFTGSNKSADSILCVDNSQFIGKTIEEAFPNLAATEIPAVYRSVAATGKPYNTEQITYSDEQGISGAFEVCAFQTAANNIAVLFRDITEKKQAQEALRRSEKRFHDLVEALPLGVFEADAKGDLTFVNSTALQWGGYERAEVIPGFNVINLVVEEERRRVVENMLKAVNHPFTSPHEYTGRRKSGDTFPIIVISKPIFHDETLAGFRGIVMDITEQRKTEREIFLERERLAVTLRSIGDGVITTDTRGRVVFLNSFAEKVTGWSNAEAFGRLLPEVFHIVDEFTRKTCENPVEKVLQTGLTVELADQTILIARDGREVVLADSGAPIKDEKGHVFGVVLVFRDVTEKQKMIESIQRTQRLDSLGILAGGIAHDFNNLLGGIFGYIDLALNDRSADKGVTEYLGKAMNVMTRAKSLTQQLLTFSKGGAPVRKAGSLGRIVQESALFALSGSNVTCRFSVDENLYSCEFDENQISQVVDNIVLNAQQAMPQGGSIDVVVTNCRMHDGRHKMLPNGRYVRLTISDSGTGIPKSILPRIFDPFFTTKEKGHGLGLATAYSIVRKHEGTIDVESEMGKGTTFFIYLPASPNTPEARSEEGEDWHFHGFGKILLMDDEEFIRDSVSIMLRRFGYEVECAKNGNEALALFERERFAGGNYELIILDLTIPGGIGGREVVAKIRESDTSIPVIVASGYSDASVLAQPEAFGFSGSIAKPFTEKEFGRLLKSIFEKRD